MDVEAALGRRRQVGVDLDRMVEVERQVRRQLGEDSVGELQGLEHDGRSRRVVLEHPVRLDDVVDLLVADWRRSAVLTPAQRRPEAYEAERRRSGTAVQEALPQPLGIAPRRVDGEASERRRAGFEAARIGDEVSESRGVDVELAPGDPCVRQRCSIRPIRPRFDRWLGEPSGVLAVGVTTVLAVGVTTVLAVGVAAVLTVGVTGCGGAVAPRGFEIIVGGAHASTVPHQRESHSAQQTRQPHCTRCGIIAAVAVVSDRDLATRFPTGDDAVLRDVYERFGGAVYTVALSILGDPSRAADVVQSTFVNAWQAAGRFNPEQELAPWLYTIARRQAIDAYRRERRARAVDAAELDDAQAAVSLEATWEAWQVRLALEQLPADERQVVRLSWFDGLAHPEIADKLGVPVGTVKSRSYRAHRRLAGLLAHVREVGEPPAAHEREPNGDPSRRDR